jgi:hypothetical protein
MLIVVEEVSFSPVRRSGVHTAVAYGGEGFGGVNPPPPPKFRSFDKAEPNSQFRGKYIRNCLVFVFHHPN